MTCSVCGTHNPADAAFCSHCGTALTADAVTGQTVRMADPQDVGARVYQSAPAAPSAAPAPTPAYTQSGSYAAMPQQSPNAVIALVLGVISILLLVLPGSSLLTAVPAIIVGKNARNEIRASNGQLRGEGMAQAGRVLGWITIGLSVIGLVLLCAFFALPFAVVPFLD